MTATKRSAVVEVTCGACGKTFTCLPTSLGCAEKLCFWCWLKDLHGRPS